MRSIRTKITVMTVCALIVAVVLISSLSVIFIRNNEQKKSDQLMLLLCETGVRNLDYYFNSTQKSVERVASFAEADLDGLDDEHLENHVERVREYFDEVANKTNGVLTYYYRIDPEVSDTVKGFWYTDLNGKGFSEHTVTDITQYDTSDTSKLVWFTVPKYQGKAIWLPPYITDNLDRRVISYNTPIYYGDIFVGVAGIEIDYSTMAEQVDSIRLYSNGYAFLNDAEGNLFYHPRIDVSELTEDDLPKIPDGAVSDSTFTSYIFQGVKKIGAWLELSNGMRLNVTAPVSETEGDWRGLIWNIVLAASEIVAIAILFTMLYTKRIVKPLKKLTQAAEQVDRGNYEFTLDYDKNDEVGALTRTFKLLTSHIKDHINTLNKRVFIDSMTKVKNKGAFSSALEELQDQADENEVEIEFAIGIFDCDDLKSINDHFGHDRGDEYIMNACQLICRVFSSSPVYRIGGDEFAIILRDEDYQKRDELIEQFGQEVEEINRSTPHLWEQVHVSVGIASYDHHQDSSVIDVMRRADKFMYENKRIHKRFNHRPRGKQ